MPLRCVSPSLPSSPLASVRWLRDAGVEGSKSSSAYGLATRKPASAAAHAATAGAAAPRERLAPVARGHGDRGQQRQQHDPGRVLRRGSQAGADAAEQRSRACRRRAARRRCRAARASAGASAGTSLSARCA